MPAGFKQNTRTRYPYQKQTETRRKLSNLYHFRSCNIKPRISLFFSELNNFY